MSTAKTWQTVSSSSDDTYELGECLGHKCKGSEVFLLVSDLGGGKTTFVQGLAKGLGVISHVGSPTFTINRVYECADGLELQHFDFYRLNDAGIVAHELSEIIDEPHAVVAIEWGDIVGDALPKKRVEVVINRLADKEDSRTIIISYPKSLGYLFEEVK